MDREKLKKNFENHGFKVLFFDNKEQVRDYIKERTEGKSVGIGGSMSAEECGLYEVLSSDRPVFWHWKSQDPDTRSKAASSDFYILSANGVSMNGELVNIDGSGNRVSASLYNPHVIYIIGMNKLEPDLESAIYRARNTASVRNAQRFGLDTPCVKGGRCYDCNSRSRICNGFVTVTRPMKGQTVELLFVDEPLGF